MASKIVITGIQLESVEITIDWEEGDDGDNCTFSRAIDHKGKPYMDPSQSMNLPVKIEKIAPRILRKIEKLIAEELSRLRAVA